MARSWYYVAPDGEEVGPVDAKEVRAAVGCGDIRPDTLVWRDDMPDWVKAGQIRKLFPEHPPPRKNPRVKPVRFIERDGAPASDDWVLDGEGTHHQDSVADAAVDDSVADLSQIDFLKSMELIPATGGTLGSSVARADRESRAANRRRAAAEREIEQAERSSRTPRLASKDDAAEVWQRAAARLVDAAPVELLRWGPLLAMGGLSGAEPLSGTLAFVGVTLFVTLPALYWTLFEASGWHATPGKKLLGLVVTDQGGRPISFLRGLARNLARVPAVLPGGAGYAAAVVTDGRQGYHDYLSGTLVCRRRAS